MIWQKKFTRKQQKQKETFIENTVDFVSLFHVNLVTKVHRVVC